MKVGDIIKIRNKIGILKISIDKELSLTSVNQGCSPYMSFKANTTTGECDMRLEVHQKNDTSIITLTERHEPKKIIVMCIDPYVETKVFMGSISTEVEEQIFETVYDD